MKIKISYTYDGIIFYEDVDNEENIEVDIDEKIWKEYNNIIKIKERIDNYIDKVYEAAKDLRYLKKQAKENPKTKSTIYVDWNSGEEENKIQIFFCNICNKEYLNESKAVNCANEHVKIEEAKQTKGEW